MLSDERARALVEQIRGESGPPEPVDPEAVARFLRGLIHAPPQQRADRLRQAEIWIRAGQGYQHRGRPVSLETMAAFLHELRQLRAEG